MNGITNPIVFYPAAVVMLLFALLMLKFKNIFYSLLSAIIVFFIAGMFFYVLGSEYNAVIQIAIYGVAVPVILGLGIMFTNNKNTKKLSTKNNFWIYLIGILFILTFTYLIIASFAISPNGFELADKIGKQSSSLWIFGQGLFIKYIWGFELISIILTIIVAGLTIFKKEGGLK